jgi:hypothetical protein
LDEKQQKTLREWVSFYDKRYPIVAKLKFTTSDESNETAMSKKND